MNLIHKLIASTYGLRMKISKLTGMGIHISENRQHITAPESFYSLKAVLNTGEEIRFEKFRGKRLLIVNLASRCGYTPQYESLENIYRTVKGLEVLGFPSNDFGSQEPGSDEEIAQFCKVNYGVTFPLFKKGAVTGIQKQEVYQWLTDAKRNGWYSGEPEWNFYKYLVDENGNLDKVYSSSVAPSDIFINTSTNMLIQA